MKKGFTILEVLGVVIILALLFAISVPMVSKVIYDSKVNLYKKNEQVLVKAADLFALKNQSYYPNEIGESKEIRLRTLQEHKYISSIVNPQDSEQECRGYVLITKIAPTEYDFTPHLKCGVNINTVEEDKLVGHWKLNGDAYDYTLNNNHGSIHGVVPTVNKHGEENKAMFFNGSSYINLGTNPILTPENITISTWVKVDTLSNWAGIISNMTSWGTGFSLQIGSNQRIANMINGTYLTTSWAPQINRWYNIVATHDFITKENKLYVDGKLENSQVGAVTYESNAKTYIGVFYTSPSLYINGSIDDIKIYSRALSEQEIINIYDLEK